MITHFCELVSVVGEKFSFSLLVVVGNDGQWFVSRTGIV
jgi:hypothetical protein